MVMAVIWFGSRRIDLDLIGARMRMTTVCVLRAHVNAEENFCFTENDIVWSKVDRGVRRRRAIDFNGRHVLYARSVEVVRLQRDVVC